MTEEFEALGIPFRQRGALTNVCIAMSIRLEVDVHGKPSSRRVQSRTRLSGDNLEQMIEDLSAFQSAGVDHIVLALNSGDVPKITELMQDIAQRVIPQFR